MYADNRIDSEYVLKAYRKAEEQLDQKSWKKIVKFADVTDGIHESIDFDDNSEINLISAKAPKNNVFDLSSTGHISQAQNTANPRTQLRKDDVIVSTVGTIGNCAVVNERVLPANADRHVGIIRIFDSEFKPRFLSSFILTKYGRYQTARFTTGNVQPNLFIYKIKDIKVPLLSEEFQNTIEQMVLNAEQLLAQSDKAIQDAEILLNGLLDISNSENNTYSVRKSSDSFLQSGRFDAEFYQPKYDKYEQSIKNYANGFTTIDDKFQLVTEKCSKSLGQYKYVEIGDINVGNGSYTYNTINTEDLPDNAKIMTCCGDILVSTVRPNRGAVAILEENNLLVSGAFTVLRPKSDYSTEILQVLLRTSTYRDWLLKFNVGTSYPVIKDKDVLNLPIPMFEENVQKEITDKVRESSRLRKIANHLLDKAIQTVEMAIETSEETALLWLEVQE
ncbi:MAG: restriction endonuclease subunit S [Clostridiales bacterium]|nr:restriction endonuclease subunit S [Clostridiales bacterium]